MTTSHNDQCPKIDPNAYVAQDATVSGDVTLGAGCRVMPGARIVAEAGGRIQLGSKCIVLENAVIRATARHNCSFGDHCLVGPGAHVVGAEIDGNVFVATGASVLHGAAIGSGAEVRINGVVHLRTRLEPGATVPIGWIAVGDPAQILPPDQHDKIWEIQQTLDFPGFVYGVDRSSQNVMQQITTFMSETLGQHEAAPDT